MPLADLVDNVPQILEEWPTQPLLFRRNPHDFTKLLTIDEVNSLVDHECLAARNVVLIKDGKVMERYTYIDGEMPRPGAVRAHLNDGGTISVRQLQTVKPSLRVLQEQIQEETGCLAHVNAYMTPAGSQGLKYHYDPYVTLIVQLAGRKTWPLHRPFVKNPMREHGNFLERGFTSDERHFLANTKPVHSFTLEPGDVFWLPRGYVHAPYTEGDETSLHLTFALKERTFHWLAERMAEEILAQAIVDPALRAEITPAALLSAPDSAIEWTRNYLLGALLLQNSEEVAELARKAATSAAR
ncbi:MULTISPECIES: JmjC domain-containing protein [unclassified Streptomyces]|uniref:JmjC domain-containing protein n=1 Tax=unclassified Streptomyces TaxID=2593676 RepID=UPI000DAB4E55|nr:MULTISPECIES: cupin domain-containing protein [unclassified Streptomyces]PZT76334.1 cupin [Streptomyces sp. AC1-42W]PZT79712.1 cupin [Streptomyces sp. AC1-42T]